MTRTAMRPPARVPGFKAPNEPDAESPAAPDRPRTADLSPRAGTKQLNLRLSIALDDRYRALVRDCRDAGVDTSMTEIVHALLNEGPRDVQELRPLVRAWRRALEDV